MSKEQELKDLYAEWFLVGRQSRMIQAEYEKSLERLNKTYNAQIEPLNQQCVAFAEREALLNKELEEVKAKKANA